MTVAVKPAAGQQGAEEPLARLASGREATWLADPARDRTLSGQEILRADVLAAKDRFARFAPLLASLFGGGWDGRVCSPMLACPGGDGLPPLLVKCDDRLPMTGSVKARGGVHELLCWVEDLAVAEGLMRAGGDPWALADPATRERLGRHRIVVASTGNLGFSIGLVARALGCAAEVHMSHDAMAWKKDRLRALGVDVIEQDCDYAEAVARARDQAKARGLYFVDDEESPRLFAGYMTAGDEAIEQLGALDVEVSPERPLVVYLPCGLGGAPGGISAGLKLRLGDAVIPVFVEPIASAAVLVAMAHGGRARPVYTAGLDNRTIADGLATPLASQLVIDRIGAAIEAVVAVPDAAMIDWMRRLWHERQWRLEPSAAAAFAAVAPFLAARAGAGQAIPAQATHLVWSTGGSLLPDAEFNALLDRPAA